MLWLFDINETLLDLAPVEAVLQDAAGRPGSALLDVWFDTLIQTALTLTAAGRYEDFGRLGALVAADVVDRAGGTWGDEALAALRSAFGSLPAHADVVPAFDALRARGDRLVPFGNSPLATIETQLRGAGLLDLVDDVVSVEMAGMLKPSPLAYATALQRQGATADEAVMVAAHGWDVLGAACAGLRTVFVTRDGRRALPVDPRPSATVTALTELAGLNELTRC
ncbi:haloacid dehalogenase type II [Lapillicoccus sp.]|uniref:haloacid dehalogenase type II n=1 Tax=Lapillicoccus sp. TaxID=1909287 RepID=UPI0025FC9DB5|nr:haloacid dehalogenase type II [Lapillicoccus sp.]